MKRYILHFARAFLVLWMAGMAACSPQVPTAERVSPTPTASPALTQATYSDPFAYCAAVGTIDAPDARYTGPKIS